MQSTNTQAAPVAFTLKLHARQRLHRADSELIELYVDARDGNPLPHTELAARLERIISDLRPAANVAKGLLPNGQKPEAPADAPHAAPADEEHAALDPDTLSSLYITDATLRRLCDHLSQMICPAPGAVFAPLTMRQLHATLEDISERLAGDVYLLMQEAQS